VIAGDFLLFARAQRAGTLEIMKILLTGATGLIGTEVMRTLAAAGHQVIATDRKGGDIPAGVDFVLGELTDDAFVNSLDFTVDAIVHLGSIPRPFDDRDFEVFNNNVSCTYKVLARAAANNVKVVIYASSLSIYGTAWSGPWTSPEFAPFDETLPLHHYESYALCKEVNERTADMWANRSKTAYVGLRFPFCNTMQAIEEHAIAQRDGDEETVMVAAKILWGYLDVRDAAQGILKILNSESIGSATYNFTAPDTTAPHPTIQMLAKFHPTTKLLREIPGYGSLTDCSRWISAYGYHPAYLIDRKKLGI
jgi:nucleoside-diphosphate-sugar epimerase